MAPDLLHQLQLGLFKHYLIPWTMELLRQNSSNRPAHVRILLVQELDRGMAILPSFQGLQGLPNGKFSTLTQLTGKEYRELAWIFLVAAAPVLVHHPKHLEGIRAGIDFMFLIHSDRTISYLEQSLQKFNKLKWAFDEQRLGSDG